ncbi:hypothetical protein VTI74DRAFT_2185 [Chaetomium olivicolor]
MTWEGWKRRQRWQRRPTRPGKGRQTRGSTCTTRMHCPTRTPTSTSRPSSHHTNSARRRRPTPAHDTRDTRHRNHHDPTLNRYPRTNSPSARPTRYWR